MKSSVLIIVLIIVIVVFTLSDTTIEGVTAEAAPSDVINIRQTSFSISFQRPYTYLYPYPFSPIIDYTGVSPQVFTIDPNLPVWYHFGIILDKTVTINTTNAEHKRLFNVMDQKILAAYKGKNKSIISKTVVFSPAQFPKFISNTKITDAAVVMRLYDLVENAYKKFLLTKKPTPFSLQQASRIPATYAGDGRIFIQRAINYPPVT